MGKRHYAYLAAAVVIAVVAAVGTMLSYHLVLAGGGSGIVAFDTARLANAQRQVAAGEEMTFEEVRTLSYRTRRAIEEHAGGRTVIVARALVLEGQIEDITGAVLRDLGLPLDAPGRGAMVRDDVETEFLDSAPYQWMQRIYGNTAPGERSRGADDLLP